MGFFTDDHDLRDAVVKVRRREMRYRTTESIKLQRGMKYVAQLFINQKCHQTCVRGSSVGSALDLESKGCWFEPTVRHYFSSNNVRRLTKQSLQVKIHNQNE